MFNFNVAKVIILFSMANVFVFYLRNLRLTQSPEAILRDFLVLLCFHFLELDLQSTWN